MIRLLRIVFSIVLVFMCYQVVTTSMQSNLFEQWNFLGSIPWMRATLWDFYSNVFFIFIWVCYKENSIWKSLIWLVLLVCLGSIATCVYVLVQLFKLKKDDNLKSLFIRKE